jgi:hypothetical protein
VYRSIRIEHFRGFSTLNVSGLRQFSLLTGKNNVGKTAVLEGLFLHAGALVAADLPLRLDLFRGMEPVARFSMATSPWDSLFYRYDVSHPVRLSADTSEQHNWSVTLTRLPPEQLPRKVDELPAAAETSSVDSPGSPVGAIRVEERFGNSRRRATQVMTRNGFIQQAEVFPTRKIVAYFSGAARTANDDVQRFSDLQVENREEEVVQAIKVIEPRIRKIDISLAAGQPRLHADIGLGRSLPLNLLGEGTARVMSFILAIRAAGERGVVLIDEFENGIHYSALAPVWRTLASDAARSGVQIVATTHSDECVRAAQEGLGSLGISDFALFRLERRDEEIHVVDYDAELLRLAAEQDLEVR